MSARPTPVTESPDAVRALVQYFNVVQVARESQVDKEVKAIAEIFDLVVERPNDDWRKLIAKANKTFQFVQMSIRAMVSEINGLVYWGLVNTSCDDVVSAVFPEKEVKLFQAMLKNLIKMKGSMTAEKALSLRCCEGQHRLSPDEANAVLKKLCLNRWLKTDKDGDYYIGERSYLEYGAFFDKLHQAGELPTCSSCKRWVILGTDDGLHFHCKERLAMQN